MSKVEGSELRSATMEVGAIGTVSPQASIEFVRSEPLLKGEAVHISFAVSEFSLAHLIGTPDLLQTLHLPDGRAQFRYSLHGPIQAHPSHI